MANKLRHRSNGGLGREYRYVNPETLEVRDGGKDAPDSILLTGMPIVYDVPYSVRDSLGEFNETMHPGVVTDLLKNNVDCRFLINHSGMPLARTLSGTLNLEDADKGLRFNANLDARQQLANDLAVAIQRGDITQMSVGMVVGRDKWSTDQQNRDIFTLKDLVDVSAVTYPASPTTSIEVAQRMIEQAEMEPWSDQVRLRKMWNVAVELRAGKVLSSANAAHVAGLLTNLKAANDHIGALAKAGGVDASSDGSGSNPTVDTNVGGEDGATGGAVSGVPNGNGPAIGSQDGAGSRTKYAGPSLVGVTVRDGEVIEDRDWATWDANHQWSSTGKTPQPGGTTQTTTGPKMSQMMSVRPNNDAAGTWHHAVVDGITNKVISSGDHPSIEEAKAAAEDAVTPAKNKKG